MTTCKGCYKYVNISCFMRAGFMSKNYEKVECPCIKCLVKSMCAVTCRKLDEYSTNLYEELHRKFVGVKL